MGKHNRVMKWFATFVHVSWFVVERKMHHMIVNVFSPSLCIWRRLVLKFCSSFGHKTHSVRKIAMCLTQLLHPTPSGSFQCAVIFLEDHRRKRFNGCLVYVWTPRRAARNHTLRMLRSTMHNLSRPTTRKRDWMPAKSFRRSWMKLSEFGRWLKLDFTTWPWSGSWRALR